MRGKFAQKEMESFEFLGFGVDEAHNNDNLTMQELMHALEESPFKQNNKLEIIAFDACLSLTQPHANVKAPNRRTTCISMETLYFMAAYYSTKWISYSQMDSVTRQVVL